jgi:putative intracellular protease/amidase
VVKGGGREDCAMKIAILIFDKLTALDAIGPYEVLSRLPEADLRFVAKEAGMKRTDTGALGVSADAALTDFTDPDIVLVPGGQGNRPLLEDEEVLEWLRAVDTTTKWTTSVCTGSLVLGAAGLLEGKRATSHWAYRHELERFGAEPVAERVVVDGKFVTAAGVSAGIDMALQLTALEYGDDLAKGIQLGIEYDPQPPFDSGSPEKADPNLVELVRGVA